MINFSSFADELIKIAVTFGQVGQNLTHYLPGMIQKMEGVNKGVGGNMTQITKPIGGALDKTKAFYDSSRSNF